MGRYNFVPLIKIVLLLLAQTLSTPAAIEAQYFFQLSINSTLHVINGISSDLQKLLKYFNGAVVVTFSRTPLLLFAAC